ncbi:hypothetical protein ACHQM5_003234 [Ranunculus cassubicifolius]
MATGAGDAFTRGVFDGSISMRDLEMNQRPYHRNCSCALHKSKKDGNGCGKNGCKNKKISFPIRRAWSESCLVLAGSKYAAASPSPSSSPVNNGSINGVDNSNWECVIRRE